MPRRRIYNASPRISRGCEAAGALGIAKETARNQSKNVFAKTGARRQAELAALLARMLGQ
jgi:DNA-binding CsgD family transcriptional regulator